MNKAARRNRIFVARAGGGWTDGRRL